jgi:hypothetical protein
VQPYYLVGENLADNIGRDPEAWRNFSDKVPLAAMVLERGDLSKNYTASSTIGKLISEIGLCPFSPFSPMKPPTTLRPGENVSLTRS